MLPSRHTPRREPATLAPLASVLFRRCPRLSKGAPVFGRQPHDGEGPGDSQFHDRDEQAPTLSCKDLVLGPGKETRLPEHPFPQRAHPPGHLLPVSAGPAQRGSPEEAGSHILSQQALREGTSLGGGRGRAEQAEGGTKGRCQAIIPPIGLERGHHSEIKSPFLKKNTNTNTNHTLSGQRKRRAVTGSSSITKSAALCWAASPEGAPGRASCPGQDTDMPDATALLWLQEGGKCEHGFYRTTK